MIESLKLLASKVKGFQNCSAATLDLFGIYGDKMNGLGQFLVWQVDVSLYGPFVSLQIAII